MGKQRRSTTGEVEEKTSTGTNGTTGAAGLRIPFRRFSLSDVLHRGTHNAHLKGHDCKFITYICLFLLLFICQLGGKERGRGKAFNC
jgi:hypothetical protein